MPASVDIALELSYISCLPAVFLVYRYFWYIGRASAFLIPLQSLSVLSLSVLSVLSGLRKRQKAKSMLKVVETSILSCQQAEINVSRF